MQSKATSAGIGQRPEMKDGALETLLVKSYSPPPSPEDKKKSVHITKSRSPILINKDGCHGDWSPYSLSAVFSMGSNVCLLMEQ